METGERILPISIVKEMETAYIDYSMSVIVSRALPDVRDGLKPVHRRVLYGMNDLGLDFNKPFKKSARIVGEVLGKYHPHGDSSVYDTMVRMAQEWSLRYPLVDGQGNFGSVDGDSPAAMRYTEARLSRIAMELLSDIEKDTVDFQNNFDDTLQEPTVLPARFPNLIVNGSSGIAVGMATNMLPHNLSEVCDGIIAYLDNPELTVRELMQHIPAPDLPTGGTIYGIQGVIQAYTTGRGRVVVRGKAEIEAKKGNERERIIITEIPYQVNKASLIERIAELVNEKRIEGIADINDESDRTGMRIVVDLKKDASANVVLSMLYNFTALQSSFGINNICLVNGRPEQLSMLELIRQFILFRLEVITRRTQFDLNKALTRMHLVRGLLAALDRLDEVIDLIRSSANAQEALVKLCAFDFSPQGDALDAFIADIRLENDRLDEVQAREILQMRLQRLTGLERDKLKEEFYELKERISYLESILASEELRRNIIREELTEIKTKFGDARQTDIQAVEGEISLEDMIANEEEIVTISHSGYVKRTLSSEYRTQGRGGRGAKAVETRDEDFIEQMFVTNTHDYLMLFTEQGRCFWMRVYEIPRGTKNAKGRAIQNLIQLPPGDKIKAYVVTHDLEDEAHLNSNFIVLCTKKGIIKKTTLEAFSRPRANGIIAININEDDQLLEARLTNGENHIILASQSGKCIRFPESDVRAMGRTATGVIGIRMDDEQNEVVSMVCVAADDVTTSLMTVSSKGYGKRSALEEYSPQARGGKGIITMNLTDKTGDLVTLKAVNDDDDLMIITKSGLSIRLALKEVRVMGRSTQGVKLINLREDDDIADVALIKDAAEGEGEGE